MRNRSTLLPLLLLLAWAQLCRAGAWTQPRGQAWIKTGFHYLLTDEQYAPTAAILEDGTAVARGDSRPFNDGGAMRMRLWWSEAEFGLHDRLTAGFQIPFYDLRFEDRFQRTDSWGVGDLRFIGRVGVLRGANRLSLRGAWKLPVGKAATDPDDVPLSEGQHDFDVGVQYGRSLGRPMSWAGLEGGHRLRLRDEETGRDPGDEWFWRIEAGYAPWEAWPFALRIGWEGLRGDETVFDDLGELPGQRRFDAWSVGFLYQLMGWTLEGGLNGTVAGEAFPVGTGWNVGVSRNITLRP